jgi:hypothetical protein
MIHSHDQLDYDTWLGDSILDAVRYYIATESEAPSSVDHQNFHFTNGYLSKPGLNVVIEQV